MGVNDVTVELGSGAHGLLGPNGAGKTTLLKMLAGQEEPDSGAVVRPAALSIGYLPQDGLSHAGRTVFEEASLAFAPLLAIKAEMHEIEHRLGDPTMPQDQHDAILTRYSDLQDQFRLGDGYSMDLRIATVLRGLGFSQEDVHRPAETFSGGWQMRIALAKLLLGRPNLLLLDEPTNHLDLATKEMLLDALAGFDGTMLFVSHDREFLRGLSNRVLELGGESGVDPQPRVYPGSYVEYVARTGHEAPGVHG